jgi:glycine cleavage system H lipoate-binding protein
MSDTPADLRYSADHLWGRLVDGTSVIRVGVTDFTQRSLGDVVEVTLPDGYRSLAGA